MDEAVSIVRPMADPVRAAKKLQDVAQSYGCEDNLSVVVLKFHSLHTDTDPLIKELRSTIRRNTVQVILYSLNYLAVISFYSALQALLF